MIVGAYYRRSIGNGWPSLFTGRTALQIGYGGYAFALGGFLTGDTVTGLLVAVTLVAAHTGPWHGETMDRGHVEGIWIVDALLMTGRFAMWGAPLCWWLDLLIWLPLWATLTSATYDLAYGLFHLDISAAPTEEAEYMQGGMWELGAIALLLLHT